jgi:pyroglutamyl-peptidase
MSVGTQPLVLVTGFEPFPGAPVNPTELLIGWLKKSGWKPRNTTLVSHVLPTRFDVFETRLGPLLNEHRPDAIVSFGLSAKAKGFTLERFARNTCLMERPDSSGSSLATPLIDPLGADTRSSTLPLAAIAHRLEAAELPWAWSDDAGGYICNLVFYRTLAAKVATAVPSGFVHVPYTTAQHAALGLSADVFSLDESDLITGARIVIEAVAELL